MNLSSLSLTDTSSKRTGLLSGGQTPPQTPLLMPAGSGFPMSAFLEKEPKVVLSHVSRETVRVKQQHAKRKSTRLSLSGNVQSANPCYQTEGFYSGGQNRALPLSNHMWEFFPAKKVLKDPQPANLTPSLNLGHSQKTANLKTAERLCPILWEPN